MLKLILRNSPFFTLNQRRNKIVAGYSRENKDEKTAKTGVSSPRPFNPIYSYTPTSALRFASAAVLKNFWGHVEKRLLFRFEKFANA